LTQPARVLADSHRASTPLELLFDLVIVIAIAALTAAFHHALADGHGAEALPRFILLFITIWWAWMGVTWFASAFGHEDAGYKLLLGVIMTGALIFAAGAGSFFDTMDLSWGLLGWSIMRLALAILWLRVARQPQHRIVALRFMTSILVAQAAWFVLFFITVPASGAALIGTLLCLALEFTLPAWAQSGRLLPWHRGHLTERYGLLMLIVLGDRRRSRCPRLRDDLHRQKARTLRQTRRWHRVRRIARIAPPFEDQVGIHRVAQRHLRNRHTRCRRLKADRPLLLIRPKPLRPTRHAITIVSTIDSGHYPALSARGSAVRPDGYA
jgi:hypothetical protein